jgi:hypothetical protein
MADADTKVVRLPQEPSGPAPPRRAGFRYGAVFALTLTEVAWLIVTPGSDWSHAVAFALQSAALVVVIATSRTRADVRHLRTAAGGVMAGALVAATAVGVIPPWMVAVGGGFLSIVMPLALGGGLLRLVRTHGVTLQAVAGSLTIYLLVGLFFAWVMGVVTHFDPDPYFATGADGTESARVYFSFTVMTTTGFGDLTAASAVGRALAVIEMLVGQLYLVTVIGVLVGSFGRR